MASDIPSISDLVEKAKKAFKSNYEGTPTIAVCAPGRVNIIGEHTDYNDGFVFPMALPLVTVIVGGKNSSQSIRIKTLAPNADAPAKIEFPLPTSENPLKPSTPAWANYMKGVIANFPGQLVGFDAVVVSSVPLGGGLSSSASLEVATYTFLECLTNTPAKSLKEKALICQKAEHDFANMPCGIMDQFISTMGKKGAAVLIDCRSMDTELVPLNDPSVAFLITNSNVRHTLTGSEYPSRRNNCHKAAEIMQVKSLRDASIDDLLQYQTKMKPPVFEQGRHVVAEISRTRAAVEFLKEKNYTSFGKLMTESHFSLRNDFKVSCSELDELVVAALQLDGVYGSRMTGGGFGGCTVTLVSSAKVDKLIEHISNTYSGKPTFYVCTPSEGAQVLNI